MTKKKWIAEMFVDSISIIKGEVREDPKTEYLTTVFDGDIFSYIDRAVKQCLNRSTINTTDIELIIILCPYLDERKMNFQFVELLESNLLSGAKLISLGMSGCANIVEAFRFISVSNQNSLVIAVDAYSSESRELEYGTGIGGDGVCCILVDVNSKSGLKICNHEIYKDSAAVKSRLINDPISFMKGYKKNIENAYRLIEESVKKKAVVLPDYFDRGKMNFILNRENKYELLEGLGPNIHIAVVDQFEIILEKIDHILERDYVILMVFPSDFSCGAICLENHL